MDRKGSYDARMARVVADARAPAEYVAWIDERLATNARGCRVAAQAPLALVPDGCALRNITLSTIGGSLKRFDVSPCAMYLFCQQGAKPPDKTTVDHLCGDCECFEHLAWGSLAHNQQRLVCHAHLEQEDFAGGGGPPACACDDEDHYHCPHGAARPDCGAGRRVPPGQQHHRRRRGGAAGVGKGRVGAVIARYNAEQLQKQAAEEEEEEE